MFHLQPCGTLDVLEAAFPVSVRRLNFSSRVAVPANFLFPLQCSNGGPLCSTSSLACYSFTVFHSCSCIISPSCRCGNSCPFACCIHMSGSLTLRRAAIGHGLRLFLPKLTFFPSHNLDPAKCLGSSVPIRISTLLRKKDSNSLQSHTAPSFQLSTRRGLWVPLSLGSVNYVQFPFDSVTLNVQV